MTGTGIFGVRFALMRQELILRLSRSFWMLVVLFLVVSVGPPVSALEAASVQEQIAAIERDLEGYRGSLAGSQALLKEIQSQPNSPDAAEAERVTRDAIRSDEAAIHAAEAALAKLRSAQLGRDTNSGTGGSPRHPPRLSREEQRLEKMRRQGKTRTLGDPARLARLLHAQSGNTCAIVAQEQWLKAMGHLGVSEDSLYRLSMTKGYYAAEIACEPPLDPADKCRVVYDAAADRYFQRQLDDPNGILYPSPSDLEGLMRRNGGTFSNHYGKLLADVANIQTKNDLPAPGLQYFLHRGTILKQHRETLEGVIGQGQLAMVTVDAGTLWRDKIRRNSLHAVLVTGLEVDKGNGKVLGYYINDSGDVPPRAGRLVPKAEFERAWKRDWMQLVHEAP